MAVITLYQCDLCGVTSDHFSPPSQIRWLLCTRLGEQQKVFCSPTHLELFYHQEDERIEEAKRQATTVHYIGS